ncbi:MAG: hypothetical protein ABH875_03500 [Candidatus Omnitrophota bacterium]
MFWFKAKQEKLKRLLALAAERKAPEQPPEFWSEFDKELKEKLSEESTSSVEIKIRPAYRPSLTLKPVFALATVALVLIMISVYHFTGLPTSGTVAVLEEDSLVEELALIEELTGETVYINGDAILDEMYLLEEV